MSYRTYINKLLQESVGDLLTPMSKEEQDKLDAERDKIFEQIYNIAKEKHPEWWGALPKHPSATTYMWLGDIITRYSNDLKIKELTKNLNGKDKQNFYYFIANKLNIDVK
jgi:hypothetical protein